MTSDAVHDRHIAIEGDETAVPLGLYEAFLAYDEALVSNDVDRLNDLFSHSPLTVRAAGGGVQAGWERIAAFRQSRAAAPTRRLGRVHARPMGEAWLLMAETLDPHGRGRGVQTQVWGQEQGCWRVLAAHVEPATPVVRGGAFDTRVWRCVGAPLVPELAPGALDGTRVAVKDLYAVRGFRIGAGVPEYLADGTEEPEHAAAVRSLLMAGAEVAGIAQTDQFAFSLAGQNASYGTPINPLHPDRIPGGSTSGPTTAVSLGQADLALGTDTAGSIRVPSSYQGLWGIRTTHDLIDRRGLIQLAESFDTVGLIAADPQTLERGLTALLVDAAPAPQRPRRVLVSQTLTELAEPWIGERVAHAADVLATELSGAVEILPLDQDTLEHWFVAFRKVQAWEAWQGRGAWIQAHPGVVGADVEARFRSGAELSEHEVAQAREFVGEQRTALRELLSDAVLVLPAASSAAPLVDTEPDEIDHVRSATLHLTCVAGIGGLPAVSMPVVSRESLIQTGGLAANACVIGAAGSDLQLLSLCRRSLGDRA